jgi:hypothetical protein
MDHRRDFELLVMNKFDKKVVDVIKWEHPRIIYIASDFRKFYEFYKK